MGGPVLKKGMLQKKTTSKFSPWQQRFVILTDTEISYAEKEGASDTATISLSNLDSAADSGDGTFCLQFKAGSKLSGSRAGKTVDKLIFKAPDTRAWAETTTGALTTFRENGGGNNQAGPSTGVPEEEAEEATPAGKGKLQLMIPAGAVDITPGVTPENSGLLSTPRGQSDGRLTPPKAATPSPRAMRVSGGFDYLGGGGTPQRPATPEVATVGEETEHSGRDADGSPAVIPDVKGTPRSGGRASASGLQKEPSFEMLPPGAEHSEHHRQSNATRRASQGTSGAPRSPRGGTTTPKVGGYNHHAALAAENSDAWATLIGEQSASAAVTSPGAAPGYSPRTRLLSITPGKRLLRAPSITNSASREASKSSVHVTSGYTRGESAQRINNVRIMELGIALSASLSNEERAKLYRIFTAYCLFGEPRNLHSALVNGAMGSPAQSPSSVGVGGAPRSPPGLRPSPSAARPSLSPSRAQIRSPSRAPSSASRVGGGIRPMSAGVYAKEENGPRMDGQQFSKVVRESHLVDKKLNLGVVGIIFLSVKDMRSRKIGYEDFLQALINIAEFKKTTIADIVRQILATVPLINSVMPANVHASRPKERSPPVASADPYITPLAIRPTYFYAQMRPSRPLDLYYPMEADFVEEPSQPPGTI